MTSRALKSDPSTDAKNLMMIQRIDVCAEAILDKATHTALYKFNSSARTWEKTEVDGAMFIYKRVDHPIYSLMIANRQSPEDLIEPILPKIRVKMDKPYLFFCKDDGNIRGLWFYREEDCERIYKLLERLIAEMKQEAKSSPPALATDNSSNVGGVFLTMLMGGGQPSSPAPSNTPLSKVQPTTASVKPVSPQGPPSPIAPPGSSTSTTAPVQSMLQKLMSEQLPPSLAPIGTASNRGGGSGGAVTAADLERDLVRQSRIPELSSFNRLIGMPPSASAASLTNFSTQSIHGSDPGDVAELESMAGGLSIVGGRHESTGGQRISPSSSSNTAVPPGLDRGQLMTGLVHLLQNDDEFLSKVHEAYVEALNRRLNA